MPADHLSLAAIPFERDHVRFCDRRLDEDRGAVLAVAMQEGEACSQVALQAPAKAPLITRVAAAVERELARQGVEGRPLFRIHHLAAPKLGFCKVDQDQFSLGLCARIAVPTRSFVPEDQTHVPRADNRG